MKSLKQVLRKRELRIVLDPRANYWRRLKALDRLETQEELAQVVDPTNYCMLAPRALERIDDQSVLTELASKYYPVRSDLWRAVRIADKLEDRALADRLYCSAAERYEKLFAHGPVGEECVKKVSDTALLVHVAEFSRDETTRQAALGRLTKKADRLEVAIQTGFADVGAEAARHLAGEDSLLRVVREARTGRAQLTAAKRLKNVQPVVAELTSIARDEKEPCQVRAEAAILTGQQDLIDMALAVALTDASSKEWNYLKRYEALASLSDQDLLYRQAYRSGDPKWKHTLSQLDVDHLERLVSMPGDKDLGRSLAEILPDKQERAIDRLVELACDGDAEAERALERLAATGPNRVGATTALGLITVTECVRQENSGQGSHHLFEDWVEEPGTPVVHVGRCKACGVTRRWWDEDCRDCGGAGFNGEVYVDCGPNVGGYMDPVSCTTCKGARTFHHETLTRQ
ncbi:MAG: hypothetical protein LBN10_06540 [Propionibacteriaceae bacterium]|jgi:hypothetical protein|nr:hypothetical protein [Propionibacteriaceae bacterium]